MMEWLLPVFTFVGVALGWLVSRAHPAPVDLDALAEVTREQYGAGVVAGWNARIAAEAEAAEAEAEAT